ncbi:MAG: cell division protein ZapE [Rubellimicrobium sp.]|nr:cell division protein ZapE [Rubellimicrobium sp.]
MSLPSSGLVSSLYNARIARGEISADPAQEAALDALDRVAGDLAQPQRHHLFRRAAPPVRGLYLWGGVGRGKSMLMDLMVEALTVPVERRHFHEFMLSVQDAMERVRATRVNDAILPVADAIADRLRCLAFDEMEINDIADAMIVGRLFERLLDRGVTVVTTSNRPPGDLYKDGLNRQLFLPFIALMEDRLEVVELAGGEDHRRAHEHEVQRYFTPADTAARAAVDAVWHGLTHGNAAPLRLHVHGREVLIPAFADGAARATFYELCDQPLGAADYLALAQAADVLILEDIPLMGADNYNQARRFVVLVDSLYEAGTRLYCTAAAPPDRLYLEGEGSFEFARTASRLIEMQARDWGARRLEK